MGISITVHSEVKTNNQWHHYGEATLDRSYRLFYKIATVMEHLPEATKGITPLSSPKGLPIDLSFVTKLQVEQNKKMKCAMHDSSWLSSVEISKLEAWWKEEPEFTLPLSFKLPIFGCYFWYLNGGFKPSTQLNDEIPPEVEDIRWVLWFN